MSTLMAPTFFFGAIAILAIVISGFVVASMRLLRGKRTQEGIVVFVASSAILACLGLTLTGTAFGALPVVIGVAIAVFMGAVLAQRPRSQEPPKNEGE